MGGVADDNGQAAALYLRLGYADAGVAYLDRWHYLDADGVRHDQADPCRFLVKALAPAITKTASPPGRDG